MTTFWTYPSSIFQYTEPDTEDFYVSWNDTNRFEEIKFFDKKSLQSNGALIHISRSPRHDIENKTYYLRITNFSFQNVPNTISGIEVRVKAQRYGRVVDDTVQLCLNGKDIGENKADLVVKPEKLYGGSQDLWGIDTLTKSDIENITFGVIIRFKAHPNWPHKDPVFVDSVEMRIY